MRHWLKGGWTPLLCSVYMRLCIGVRACVYVFGCVYYARESPHVLVYLFRKKRRPSSLQLMGRCLISSVHRRH